MRRCITMSVAVAALLVGSVGAQSTQIAPSTPSPSARDASSAQDGPKADDGPRSHDGPKSQDGPSAQSTPSTQSAPSPEAPSAPITVQDTNPLDEGVAFSGSSELSDDYQLGPGDLIEVQVVGHDDMTQSVRVSNSGEVSLSMIGLLKVTDLTGFEVESLIASKIREKELIREPDVLVFVREYQSKPIYVSGAVVTAGEFVMSRELTVADAILLAGGLRFNAGDDAYLHRRVSLDAKASPVADITSQPTVARPGDQVIKVDLRPLKQGRFFEVSTPMKKGDVVVVPQRQMNSFFVVGDVIDPRNFVYPPGATLMVSQAISWAQGPTPTAKMSQGMLVRYDGQGNRQETNVDYAAILSGRQPDFPIQPNDIIFIPGSVAKTLAHGLVQATGVMLMQQSFRYGRRVEMSSRADQAAEEIQRGSTSR